MFWDQYEIQNDLELDLSDGPSPSEAELILAKELPRELIDRSDGLPGIDEDDNDQQGLY